MKNKQTKAQRCGTLSNMRRGYLYRMEIVRNILPVSKHNPHIHTCDLVKYINKKMKSRKQNKNVFEWNEKSNNKCSDETKKNEESKQQGKTDTLFSISETEIIRAIKEHIDDFPKEFIDVRKMELDSIELKSQNIVDKRTLIDSFFSLNPEKDKIQSGITKKYQSIVDGENLK